MTHWATAYIGEPYVPQANDCWAFCRRVWAERFGLEVPAVALEVNNLRSITRAISRHPERLLWAPVEYPREGDAVLMAHNRYPCHVGLWVDADGGGVLHCVERSGVVFSNPQALERAGWARLQFYRRVPA